MNSEDLSTSTTWILLLRQLSPFIGLLAPAPDFLKPRGERFEELEELFVLHSKHNASFLCMHRRV